MAERFQGDEFALVRDGYGRGREGAMCDGVAEDGKSDGENFLLLSESGEKRWREVVQSWLWRFVILCGL